jgi:hypothetical protein
MSGAFQYRPKFVDIRIRPPKPGEEDEVVRDDVFKLKPGESCCEWGGCRTAGAAKAPKSRDLPGEFYWFCQPHAAEYNRNWDFFAGMSEGEIRRRREDEIVTGGRPTWQFRASKFSREAASIGPKLGAGQGYQDPFGMFGGRKPPHEEAQPDRRLGKLERQALADLDLEAGADKARIRTRYKELVKRTHPDSNGGDRSAEDKLQRVLKAYKTLQKAKLA